MGRFVFERCNKNYSGESYTYTMNYTYTISYLSRSNKLMKLLVQTNSPGAMQKAMPLILKSHCVFVVALEENDATTFNHEVQIIYEFRGCGTSAVTSQCTSNPITSDVAGSNLDVHSCEETCTGHKCNTDWRE